MSFSEKINRIDFSGDFFNKNIKKKLLKTETGEKTPNF